MKHQKLLAVCGAGLLSCLVAASQGETAGVVEMNEVYDVTGKMELFIDKFIIDVLQSTCFYE